MFETRIRDRREWNRVCASLLRRKRVRTQCTELEVSDAAIRDDVPDNFASVQFRGFETKLSGSATLASIIVRICYRRGLLDSARSDRRSNERWAAARSALSIQLDALCIRLVPPLAGNAYSSRAGLQKGAPAFWGRRAARSVID
jgi:hypothetical protein